jgi:hypothetical protein
MGFPMIPLSGVGPQPQPLDRNEREDGARGGHDNDDELELDPSQYVHVHVADILAQGFEEGGLYKLPEHLRCAAHTMNLVATTDVRNVLENDSLHKSAIDQKANDLWKKQRASTNAVDIIVKQMGRRLVTPGQTRWNSKHDTLICLTKLMEGENTRQVILLNGSKKYYQYILSTYNAKIIIILYTFLKFDNKN